MAARKTIYLPDDVLEIAGADAPLSTRINSMLRRYRWITNADRPALTEAEWCTVCEACSGFDDLMFGERPEGLGTSMWASVADAADVAERHGVADHDALVQRMRKWTPAQVASAYEAINVFWRNSDQPGGLSEAIRRAVSLARGQDG